MHVPPPPFQQFLDGHGRDVYRFLVAAVGPADADDCFQETFLAALRAYGRLDGGSNMRAWVLTIAHRKAIDAARARRRRPVPLGDVPEAASPVRDEQPDAELWARVRELPPRQRDALFLRFAADLSFREIAAVVDCSEDAARRRAFDGLTNLRRWSSDD